MTAAPFDLFLFSTDPSVIRQTISAGAAGIVVDWERIGKRSRQASADTQVNQDTLEDLRRARAATDATVLCRINAPHAGTPQEVEEAVQAGADELLIPMVRTPEELQPILGLVEGRMRVGILIETLDAVRNASGFANLPLSRVYLGLNDLAIERRSTNIFAAVADGTVERVRRQLPHPFGFAGLTLPERGKPIPCRLLVGEMARLDCSFSFLRRSYHRDVRGKDPAREIPRILEAMDAARARRTEQVQADRRELLDTIETRAARTLVGDPRP